jgi:AcrR family transcriptional regulator
MPNHASTADGGTAHASTNDGGTAHASTNDGGTTHASTADGGAGRAPMAGRRAQAARNDGAILAAARDVFLDDPKAPVAAVAERAGVGMSALYRRYPGKEDLLRKLCHDGLRRFIAEAEAASEYADGWEALEAFLIGVVEADVHSLTVHLAGTFAPTPATPPSPATAVGRHGGRPRDRPARPAPLPRRNELALATAERTATRTAVRITPRRALLVTAYLPTTRSRSP